MDSHSLHAFHEPSNTVSALRGTSRGEFCQRGGHFGRQNIAEPERYGSVVAGAGLVVYGLMKGTVGGVALALMGGGLLYRGITGHCMCYEALGINRANDNPAIGVPARQGYRVDKTIVIQRPAEEVYKQWRDLAKLPQFMQHLKSVTVSDELHSHWVAKSVLGQSLEWDAEIINEVPGQLLAWRSLPGGDVETAGSLRLEPLAEGAATQATVTLKYNPPLGKLGASIASLMGEGMEQKLQEDLQNFKRLLEARVPAESSIAKSGYTNEGPGPHYA